MISVGELLHGKKHIDLCTATPDQTMQEALELMAERRISSLPVLEAGRLVGIVSERDYIRKAVPRRLAPWDVRVEDLMTRDVVCVGPSDSVQHCMQLMTAHAIRHLPVVDEGGVRDMVSITDVMRVLVRAGTAP